jgi:hypothetical protein
MKSDKQFWIFLAIFLVMTVALFTSCSDASRGKKGADGYYFEKETFTRTQLQVNVVLVQSQAEMTALIKEKDNVQGTINPNLTAAFSTLAVNEPRCTIYMLDPKVQYEPEFIGHELVHCIYGVWHKEPQS